MLIGSLQPGKAEISQPIQPLSLEQFNHLLQSQYRCTLVAFLAAWCVPCIEELPDLVEIDKRYHNSGLEVIGISIDFEGPRAIEPLLAENKVNFPVYWAGSDVTNAYGITGIPLLLLMQDGKVIGRIKGKRKKRFLNDAVEGLLGTCLQEKAGINGHRQNKKEWKK